MAYPDYFTCPISLDIFTDPVTLCTGHTYDRPYIEKWLAAGNLTCPVTMQKLHDISLVPNHTLRQLINQWLQTTTWPSSSQHYQYRRRSTSSEMQRSFSSDDGTMLSGSGIDIEVLLPSLKQALESKEFVRSFEILKPIRGGLLVDGCEERRGLFRFGFVSLVLNLVFGGEKLEEKYYESCEEMQLLVLEVIEEALCFAVKLLLPFSSSELASLNVLLKEEEEEEEEDTSRNNLASKVEFLLQQGTRMMKVSLCTLMESVITSSSSNETKELLFNTVINNDAEIVRTIINLLLHDDVDDEELHESGTKVLSALLLLILSPSSTTDLHTAVLETLIVQDRVIDLLINYILRSSSQGRKIKNDKASSQATKALEGIITIEKGKQALIDNPNGIRAFVKMIFKVSDDHQGSESAVNSLIILCCDSVPVREEAIRRGVLTQLLLLIQSQCNVKTKTKARMLLKLLRSMWR